MTLSWPRGPPSNTGWSLPDSGSTNQSSSSVASTNGVNSLSQTYPNLQQNLYVVPTTAEQADTTQPIRHPNVDQILIAAFNGSGIPPAIQHISALLRQRHHLRITDPDDFRIRDMTEITKAMSSTAELMTKLLLCVAMISLVSAGSAS